MIVIDTSIVKEEHGEEGAQREKKRSSFFTAGLVHLTLQLHSDRVRD
jgi:hypothetical protein